MRILITILLILSVNATVVAADKGGKGKGPGEGGGGKGIVCNENGQEKYYLADTFDLIRSGALKEIEMSPQYSSSYYPGRVIESIVTALESLHPEKVFPHPFLPGVSVSMGWMVAHKSANLLWSDYSWAKELNDDNIDPATLPGNCQKVQLVSQDIRNGVANYHPMDLKLTPLELGLLKYHEILIAIRNAPGADTTPIRQEVAKQAEILNDPRLAVHELVLQILRPIPDKTPYPEHFAANDFWNANCTGPLAFPRANPDSHGFNYSVSPEKELACKKTAEEIWAAMQKRDQETSLKTLMHIPRNLDCKIMNYEERVTDSPFLPRPSRFTVSRTSGDGRPKGHSQYKIEFEKPMARLHTEGSSGNLITHRHMRQEGFRDTGLFKISISWSQESQSPALQVSLSLDKYMARTDEFVGRMQVAEGAWWSTHGVSCSSDDVEFSYDFDQSF